MFDRNYELSYKDKVFEFMKSLEDLTRKYKVFFISQAKITIEKDNLTIFF